MSALTFQFSFLILIVVRIQFSLLNFIKSEKLKRKRKRLHFYLLWISYVFLPPVAVFSTHTKQWRKNFINLELFSLFPIWKSLKITTIWVFTTVRFKDLSKTGNVKIFTTVFRLARMPEGVVFTDLSVYACLHDDLIKFINFVSGGRQYAYVCLCIHAHREGISAPPQ